MESPARCALCQKMWAVTEEHSSNRGALSCEALKVATAVQEEKTRTCIHVYFYIILLNVCLIGTLAEQLLYIDR